MKKIGVLLSNRETKEPVGFVEIAPSGMLILAAFEGGIHPYALRPLTEELLDQPLYVKHSDIISRDKVLPYELLIAESLSWVMCRLKTRGRQKRNMWQGLKEDLWGCSASGGARDVGAGD